MINYDVRIADEPDRDDCFVELCLDGRIIAEVSNRNGEVVVEWFATDKTQRHDCAKLISALQWSHEQMT